MTRSDSKNKLLAVWIAIEDHKKLEDWLDKFSAGANLSEQMRTFIHWLVSQTEGIDQTVLALQLQQKREEKQKRESHCIRGAVKDWHTSEVKQGLCVACRQHYPREFEECRRRRRELENQPPDSDSMKVSKSSE